MEINIGMPVNCMSAIIPVYQKQQVKLDLERDVAQGVLENVSSSTSVTQCHRMILSIRHSGELRPMTNLQIYNDECK